MSSNLYVPDSYYVSERILIAAEISGYKYKRFPAKSAENPIIFEHSGQELFDPSAIASFVGNDQLRGTGKNESEVIQWVNWSDKCILPALSTWVYPLLGVGHEDKHNLDKAKHIIKDCLSKLNSHLETKTFIVGERLTQADITVACNLRLLFENVFDPSYRSNIINVERWYTTVMNQPASLKVFGREPVLLDKEKEHHQQPRQHKRSHRKSSGSHHQNLVENHEPQKSQKPVNQPKVTQKPAEKPDDDDDDTPKEPKPKDPFLALPKGNFDMDEWKRTYSNNDCETVAIPWLWEHLDKENYSLWFCEYSFNHELKLVFMTCNLIGGMFQRLEKMRKHAFGSMCIFGENNNNTVSGVWLWRGQDLAFKLDGDLQLDYEYYKWTKLNPDDEKDKKTITEYFVQKGEFDGKVFNQGKIYK